MDFNGGIPLRVHGRITSMVQRQHQPSSMRGIINGDGCEQITLDEAAQISWWQWITMDETVESAGYSHGDGTASGGRMWEGGWVGADGSKNHFVSRATGSTERTFVEGGPVSPMGGDIGPSRRLLQQSHPPQRRPRHAIGTTKYANGASEAFPWNPDLTHPHH